MDNNDTKTEKTETNEAKRIVTCPLCGMSFDANKQQACKSCNKQRNCPLVSCPNCYHEFLPT